jgi:hypothetical protein
MIQIECSVLDEDIDGIAEGWVGDQDIVNRIMTDLMEFGIIDEHWGKYIYNNKGEYFVENDDCIQRQVEQYIANRLASK